MKLYFSDKKKSYTIINKNQTNRTLTSNERLKYVESLVLYRRQNLCIFKLD